MNKPSLIEHIAKQMSHTDDEIKAMIAEGTMTQEVWSGASPYQRSRVADTSGLCPELVGKEGWRVEATVDGERRRFQVGESTGWKPCHLSLHSRASSGGSPIRPGTLSDITVIRAGR